jgi:hypothetical protein
MALATRIHSSLTEPFYRTCLMMPSTLTAEAARPSTCPIFDIGLSAASSMACFWAILDDAIARTPSSLDRASTSPAFRSARLLPQPRRPGRSHRWKGSSGPRAIRSPRRSPRPGTAPSLRREPVRARPYGHAWPFQPACGPCQDQRRRSWLLPYAGGLSETPRMRVPTGKTASNSATYSRPSRPSPFTAITWTSSPAPRYACCC